MGQILFNTFFILVAVVMAYATVLLIIVKIKVSLKMKNMYRPSLRPSGSEVEHGMIRDPENRGVLQDSQETLTWYSRAL